MSPRGRAGSVPGLAFGEGSDDPALVRSMLESAPDGLLVADTVGLIAYVNRRLEEISGYSRSDLVGSPVESLVPDTSAQLHRSLHDEYRKHPRTRLMGDGRHDLTLLRADGSQIPVEIGLSAVQVARGRTMTVASVRDVREQRAADRRRQRLLAMLDMLPEAVFALDGEFVVLYANAAAGQWYGAAAEELVGLTIWDFDADLPRVSPAELEELLRPEPGAPAVRRMTLRTKAGGGIPCEARVQLSVDPELGPRRVVLLHDLRARIARDRQRARRAALAELVTEVTAAVLGGTDADAVFARVVAGARTILDADDSAVLVPGPGAPRRSIRALSGDLASRVPQSALPILRDVPAFLAEHPAGAVLDGPPAGSHRRVHAVVGPMAIAPLADGGTAHGVLAIARRRGREPFTGDDLDLLRLLGQQTALAVELGAARVDRERLEVLEDRQRIGRELHDGVVQDVIGVGMALSRLGSRLPAEQAEQAAALVAQLEATVRRLRHAVFDLQPHSGGLPATLALAGLVAEASRALGFEPDLTLHGPVDDLAPDVADELAAAAREALSNVARHAHATTARVRVEVTEDRLRLVVEDDGVGLSAEPRHGEGIRNMAGRAERLGGSAELSAADAGGTRLVWSVPLG